MSPTDLRALAEEARPGLIRFCQRLIQTPSPSGQEGAVAALVQEEMQRLGFDRVWTDAAGNVIGLVRGRGGPPGMFNAHMDHVDPGDPSRWPYPPFGGEIHDGKIWGRGTADVKGPLAAMIHALGTLLQAGLRPAGDVYLAAVVMEEVGGWGTQHLLREVHPAWAVVGEATGNQLARGQRGRIEVVVRFTGRSVHASTPERGANPHYALARFLSRLQNMEMARDPEFGSSTVAPTLIRSDVASDNIIPGELRLHLDWRNIPGESPEDVLARLRPLVEASLIPGCTGTVELHQREMCTYTGQEVRYPDVFPSFGLPADHPLVEEARRILARALGRPVDAMIWRFATDGGHLMQAGVPAIGFAPAEKHLVHTPQEHIDIDMLVEGLVGYMALALELK